MSALPTRSAVIEILSWAEDTERGRWGTEFATEVVENIEAIARGRIYPHHEGPWSLDLGECRCECRSCYSGDGKCLCPDCADPHHDHSERPGPPADDTRVTAQQRTVPTTPEQP